MITFNNGLKSPDFNLNPKELEHNLGLHRVKTAAAPEKIAGIIRRNLEKH